MTDDPTIAAIMNSSRSKSARIRALVSAGVPKAEIARLLDISANHVYSTLSRDRDKGRAVVARNPATVDQREMVVMVSVDEHGRIILAPEVLEHMKLRDREVLVLVAFQGEAHVMTRERAAATLKAQIAAAAPGQAQLAEVLLSDFNR